MNMEAAQKKTILIVDDTPDNLALLFEILSSKGYRVLTAESGESALERVKHITPDLIIMDVMMPGIDGFETALILKEKPELGETPLIFVTALNDRDAIVKAYDAGAVDYINKPIRSVEVIARVETHLRLRQLQLDREKQIEERDILISELDSFAHSVAHDLRGPIQVVQGMSEALSSMSEDLSNEEKREFTENIHEYSLKLNDIVEALLTLASVRKEDVPVELLIHELIWAEVEKRVEPMVIVSNAEITRCMEWPEAMGCASWMEEVWVNYISNAIKYGGNPPRVEIEAFELDGRFIRFGVRDNGKGVSEEDRERLFAPFSRLKQARIDGHGLGLSIVQRIAEKLNGRVGVLANESQGSFFYIDLPKSTR